MNKVFYNPHAAYATHPKAVTRVFLKKMKGSSAKLLFALLELTDRHYCIYNRKELTKSRLMELSGLTKNSVPLACNELSQLRIIGGYVPGSGTYTSIYLTFDREHYRTEECCLKRDEIDDYFKLIDIVERNKNPHLFLGELVDLPEIDRPEPERNPPREPVPEKTAPPRAIPDKALRGPSRVAEIPKEALPLPGTEADTVVENAFPDAEESISAALPAVTPLVSVPEAENDNSPKMGDAMVETPEKREESGVLLVPLFTQKAGLPTNGSEEAIFLGENPPPAPSNRPPLNTINKFYDLTKYIYDARINSLFSTDGSEVEIDVGLYKDLHVLLSSHNGFKHEFVEFCHDHQHQYVSHILDLIVKLGVVLTLSVSEITQCLKRVNDHNVEPRGRNKYLIVVLKNHALEKKSGRSNIVQPKFVQINTLLEEHIKIFTEYFTELPVVCDDERIQFTVNDPANEWLVKTVLRRACNDINAELGTKLHI